jgi:hypothetical protein
VSCASPLTEQQIHRAVFQHLTARKRQDVFAFHPANGGARSAIEAAIFKGLGVRAGVPDIIAIRSGHCFALELKRDSGGRLSGAQQQTHNEMRAAGVTVAVAYGLDEALGQLTRWGLLR